MPLINDLHPRAGAPPSQDDAVELGRARRILSAPDERRERTVPVLIHDFIHGLESNDVPVHARLSPENLPDVRADARRPFSNRLVVTTLWYQASPPKTSRFHIALNSASVVAAGSILYCS